MKGVELQEKRALVEDIFFNVLVIDPLQLQCPYHPVGKRASPEPQKLYFLLRHEMILAALTANNEIYLGHQTPFLTHGPLGEPMVHPFLFH